ncbi:MAG: hypothetical protein R3E46_14670 [Sedimenticolaceae bacterium]
MSVVSWALTSVRRAGFTSIRVRFEIDADPKDMATVIRELVAYSPIMNTH